MDRRQFLGNAGTILLGGAGFALAGCRGAPQAQVMTTQKDMTGTTKAGTETFGPLVEEAVGKLLARQSHGAIQQAGLNVYPPPRTVCFACFENKSDEELGDFKEQVCQTIDTKINQSGTFKHISQRYVQAGLQEARLRPDQLFLPNNQRAFLAVMEKQGQPFDYLLFATLTSGTTQGNGEFQRDYLLTLELVNIHTGEPDKESASLRKGYYGSRVGKWMHK